jgi:hypothetical protein
MLPWLILALVALPLLVVGFLVTRRRQVAGERPASPHMEAAEAEEFAAAEAYEAEWREDDRKRFRRERLP